MNSVIFDFKFLKFLNQAFKLPCFILLLDSFYYNKIIDSFKYILSLFFVLSFNIFTINFLNNILQNSNKWEIAIKCLKKTLNY